MRLLHQVIHYGEENIRKDHLGKQPEQVTPDNVCIKMSNKDLTNLLMDWPYEMGQINARQIKGDDGKPKMQIRVSLGVLQLEIEGRPDGLRPEGFESLLDYQLDRLKRYTAEAQGAEGFVLSPDECRALREEAILYYHRYVGLFVLEDFAGVICDTARNLQVIELCKDFAATPQDRASLEQFRPYILMMQYRARASEAIGDADTKRAISEIDAGIKKVKEALHDLGFGDRTEDSNEMQLLRGMRDALIPKLPTSQRVELQERLKSAIDSENYELAAILRDELRILGD